MRAKKISASRVDQGEAVGPENGCDGGETAVNWLEEVKRSRFVAGKMTERTYEKTDVFLQFMTKKHKNAHKRA